MDINTLFSAFKENKWLSLVPVLAPFVIKVITLLIASKIEKQLFKPKQRIYTKTLSLVLHSILATSIAYILFFLLGTTITNMLLLVFIFLVYFIIFLIGLPLLEVIYRPVYYIEDDKHGKLYLQNVDGDGKLFLFSKPNPSKENGFYIIKEDTSVLLNTKIHSVRKDQYLSPKKIFMFIIKPFKKKQNVSP